MVEPKQSFKDKAIQLFAKESDERKYEYKIERNQKILEDLIWGRQYLIDKFQIFADEINFEKEYIQAEGIHFIVERNESFNRFNSYDDTKKEKRNSENTTILRSIKVQENFICEYCKLDVQKSSSGIETLQDIGRFFDVMHFEHRWDCKICHICNGRKEEASSNSKCLNDHLTWQKLQGLEVAAISKRKDFEK